MKKTFSLFLGLLFLAVLAATSNLSAQTIGGDTSLNSKTYSWTGLTAPLPVTQIFMPTMDSDVIITVYVGIDPANQNACVQPIVTYTDNFGSQQAVFNTLTGGGGPPFTSTSAGGTLAIHVAANTPVSVSAVFDGICGSSQTASYNIAFGKIKINP